MDRIRQYTRANGAGWEKFAGQRPAHDARFFAAGNTSLDDIEAELLGNVAGRSLLHLACANGNDTLSWAVLGAAVTGVDIAPAGLAVARQTAAAAGLDAAFVCADVYDLPPELPAFDIVYMSGGGICWMPDLDRRAQLVAAHLVPGGVAAIIEHHPLWDRLAAGHRADLVHLAGRRRAGEPQQGRPARDPLRRAPGAGHVRRARAAGRLAARLLFGPGQPSRLAAGTAPAQALGVDRSAHRAHAAELTGARTGRTLRG